MAWHRDWQAFNPAVIEQCRAHGGHVPGRQDPVLVLTTTGATSGVPRTTPLKYSLDGDRIVVIASKAASPTHPDWDHHLVANPQATVEIGTETFPVCATIAAGEERARLFNAQAALMPLFADYQQQPTRQIPVMVFERMG